MPLNVLSEKHELFNQLYGLCVTFGEEFVLAFGKGFLGFAQNI